MKNLPLVYQYLEDIPYDVLKSDLLQGTVKKLIHKRRGIYALYKNEKLVYVGLATKTNLYSRIKHHLRDKLAGKWDSFGAYLINIDEHIKEIESLLLRIAFPKRNLQKGKLPRAENLLRKYKQGIKEAVGNFTNHRKNNEEIQTMKNDTILCSARKDGFERAFLKKKAWWAIRIHPNKIDHIKYIAMYQVAPISAITHYGIVKNIKKYGRTGKYIVHLKGAARKLRIHVILGGNPSLKPQAPRYTNLKAIKSARTLDDIF